LADFFAFWGFQLKVMFGCIFLTERCLSLGIFKVFVLEKNNDNNNNNNNNKKPKLAVIRSAYIPHVVPSPWKPFLHSHVNDPIVLLQIALTLQLWVLVAHSSISSVKLSRKKIANIKLFLTAHFTITKIDVLLDRDLSKDYTCEHKNIQ